MYEKTGTPIPNTTKPSTEQDKKTRSEDSGNRDTSSYTDIEIETLLKLTVRLLGLLLPEG